MMEPTDLTGPEHPLADRLDALMETVERIAAQIDVFELASPARVGDSGIGISVGTDSAVSTAIRVLVASGL